MASGAYLVLALVCGLGGASFVASVPLGWAPDTFSAVLGVGFGLFFLLLAYVFYRRGHPPRLRGVRLTVLPAQVAPGETVEVTVEFRSAPKVRGRFKAGLRGQATTTHTDGDSVTYSTEVLHEEARDLSIERLTHQLQFSVPSNAEESGPCSDRGDLTWLGWVSRSARLFDRELAQLVTVSADPRSSPDPAQAQAHRREAQRRARMRTLRDVLLALLGLLAALGSLFAGALLGVPSIVVTALFVLGIGGLIYGLGGVARG